MKKSILALSFAVLTLGAFAQTPAKKTKATAPVSKSSTAKADSVKKAKEVKKVSKKKAKK